MAVYSFDQKDSSALAQNPLAGLLSGGFNFAPIKQYGGKGNTASSTPTATATLTPTQSNTTTRAGDGAPTAMDPTVPFADGLFGFGNQVTAAGGLSLAPAILMAAALLIMVAITKK